jgi:hypothetical protein
MLIHKKPQIAAVAYNGDVISNFMRRFLDKKTPMFFVLNNEHIGAFNQIYNKMKKLYLERKFINYSI